MERRITLGRLEAGARARVVDRVDPALLSLVATGVARSGCASLRESAR